jgi:replication-associated recombination protein RarA
VFDDSDSVFDYPISVNILKAALDSYDRRWVSWYSSVAEQQDLDPSFEFTGKIIFISNRFIERIDPAIRSRAFCFNLKMSNSEISEHMGNIVKDIETGIHIGLRREALDYLKTIQDQFTNYSLRVLIQAIRIRAYCAGTDKDWKQMIKVLACNV